MPKVTEVFRNAFLRCKSLTTVNMPKATTIRDHAFGDCESLTTVNVPKAANIPDEAFHGCRALAHVACPAAAIGNVIHAAAGPVTVITDSKTLLVDWTRRAATDNEAMAANLKKREPRFRPRQRDY